MLMVFFFLHNHRPHERPQRGKMCKGFSAHETLKHDEDDDDDDEMGLIHGLSGGLRLCYAVFFRRRYVTFTGSCVISNRNRNSMGSMSPTAEFWDWSAGNRGM